MSDETAETRAGTDRGSGRYQRLAGATARLRERAGSLPLDKWLQVAGGVLLPAAAVLILLGWYGASRTTRVWEQVPYLISGGVLGLAFAFVGGFAYFAYWLTRLVEEERRRADEAREASERMAATLERIEAALAPEQARATAGDGPLVATPTGSLMHRPDCRAVADVDEVRRVDPGTTSLRPCKLCHPLNGETAAEAGGAEASPSRTSQRRGNHRRSGATRRARRPLTRRSR